MDPGLPPTKTRATKELQDSGLPQTPEIRSPQLPPYTPRRFSQSPQDFSNHLQIIFDSANDGQRPREAELDIVAVHGLNLENSRDHAHQTWTEDGKLWLRDFLPDTLPLPARVMLFDYEASPSTGPAAADIHAHAKLLLQLLNLRRTDKSSRPIVFIAHCFGGLVVKEALAEAASDASLQHLVEAVRLIVFFATPHRGNLHQTAGDLMARLAMTSIVKPSEVFLGTLGRNSNRTTMRFKKCLHRYKTCQFLNFFGERKTGTVVDKWSMDMSLPRNRLMREALQADHASMCHINPVRNAAHELILKSITQEIKRALGWTSPEKLPSHPPSSVTHPGILIHRLGLLDNIRDYFATSSKAHRDEEAKKLCIWGPAGVGKSQLALSYLQRYRGEYDATFRIRADQLASVDIHILMMRQFLTESPSSISVSIPQGTEREVLNWFTETPRKYLFIFDGVDYSPFTGDNLLALSEYFPNSPNVHIIITSGASIDGIMPGFKELFVPELDEEQSIQLFLRCARLPTEGDEIRAEAGLIVTQLRRLPLSISMAGKYVSQNPDLPLPQHLEEFRRGRNALSLRNPYGGVDESVIIVWEMCYSAVYEHLPDACHIMTLLCFLHNNDIFLELFGLTNDSGSTAAPSWTSILESREIMDSERFAQCFEVLEEYSFCQRHTHNSYSIHPLVHAWGYYRLRNDTQKIRSFWHAAAQLLSDYLGVILDRQDGQESVLRVVPHLTDSIRKIRMSSTIAGWDQRDSLPTLRRFRLFLNRIERRKEAMLAAHTALEVEAVFYDRQLVLSNQDSNIALTTNDLATTREVRTNLHLETQANFSGEFRHSVTGRSGFGSAYRNEDSEFQAPNGLEEVFEHARQALGDEEGRTSAAIDNPGFTLGKTEPDKLEEVASRQRQVLEEKRRALGDEHPETTKVMRYLAATLSMQGKSEEAALIMSEALQYTQVALLNKDTDNTLAMDKPSALRRIPDQLGEAGMIENTQQTRDMPDIAELGAGKRGADIVQEAIQSTKPGERQLQESKGDDRLYASSAENKPLHAGLYRQSRSYPEELVTLSIRIWRRMIFSLSEHISFTPPSRQGHKRLKWKCSCGRTLWGDFDNSNPEAVNHLNHELQKLGQTKCVDSTTTHNKDNVLTTVSDTAAEASGHTPTSSGETTLASGETPGVNVGPKPFEFISHANAQWQNSFFEVCVNTGEHAIRLGEINISSIKYDGELFDKIWEQYSSIRGYGLRSLFIKPRDIHFVYFGVRHRYLAGIYKKPLEIPPEEEVQAKRYHYYRCPMDTLPPMPSNVFLHYLYCAGKQRWTKEVPGAHKEMFFLQRLPKKVNGSIFELFQRIEGQAQPQDAIDNGIAYGWGVHILEGPNHKALSLALACGIVMSFLVSVLAIGIAGTQEQGFGIGQWMVAVLACIMAALYFWLAEE